ncbi:MAG: aldo/keto reductase [Verrucomicrobiota bacterium]
MNKRRIGKSEVYVSEMSLGCWTMGGLNFVEGKPNGWANVDEDQITAAVKTAIENGVNHFDNADVYGNGRAERMLARVFKKLGLNSEEYIVASKVGHFKGDAAHAYEPDHIRRQCEQSLLNLQRDYIDLYYLHHGDFGKDDLYLQGAADTLNALQKEGKIRVKGQSAYRASEFEKSVPIVNPDVLQSWAHAMDDKFIEPTGVVGQLLKKNHLSFVAFSPLNQGILLDKFDPEKPPQFEAGDHRKGSVKFTTEFLRRQKPKISLLKKRFGNETSILSSTALRYVLNHPHVACVIPGFRNERQVLCNLSVKDSVLTKEDMDFIRSLFSD